MRVFFFFVKSIVKSRSDYKHVPAVVAQNQHPINIKGSLLQVKSPEMPPKFGLTHVPLKVKKRVMLEITFKHYYRDK